jgi:ABC-type oligopeptide transport system substrate-binding subunit
MRRTTILLLAIVLLTILLLACDLGDGSGDNATPTPIPPAASSGMDALNSQAAEGLTPDCTMYPTWLDCP